MRNVLLILVLFLIGLISYSFLLEPYSLHVTPIDLRSGKDIRIVFFSDLHMRSMFWYHRILIGRIEDLDPDFILFGGDVGKPGLAYEDLELFFTELASIAPVYAVMGNWDYNIRSRLNDIYHDSGVTLLDGETAILNKDGNSVKLVGMPLNRKFWIDDSDNDVIVMQHYAHASGRYSGPLPIIYLAGHTHGTQFYIPYISEWLFGERLGFVKGLYNKDDGSMIYVTNGIGAWLNFRFMAPPEIVLIEL